MTSPFSPRSQQWELRDNEQRFSVLVVHRRFGKTCYAVDKLIRDVLAVRLPNPRGHYFAPFLKQARAIAWDYLNQYTAHIPGMVYHKSELSASFPNGARITLHGADNPETFKGAYSDSVVMDEVAQMSPRMWGEVVRPTLADRKGKALFIGTPWGRNNLFFALFDKAGQLDGWTRQLWTCYETDALDPEELELMRLEMDKGEFDQEMLCSWSAQVKGAYYAEKLDLAEKEGRIGGVPYQEDCLVGTSWDLGINDATAVWFWQICGREIHFIDYKEFTGAGLPDIIRELQTYPYIYDYHIGPHDIKVRELGSGVTRLETAARLGMKFNVARNIAVIDGINGVRDILGRCWFDEKKCRDGLEALRLYRSDWDDVKRVASLRPVHDWTSHASDAMRYFAVEMSKGGKSGRGASLNYDMLDRIA